MNVFANKASGSLVRLRGGRVGEFAGRCDITGKYKVRTYKDGRGREIDPPTIADNTITWTTWLLDDDGHCRGDRADSPLDCISA